MKPNAPRCAINKPRDGYLAVRGGGWIPNKPEYWASNFEVLLRGLKMLN